MCDYRKLSILDLAERIVLSSDKEALREFHDHRTVFRFKGSRSMLFGQFLDKLRTSRLAYHFTEGNDHLLDRAYDLTVEKFFNIPQCDSGEEGEKKRGHKYIPSTYITTGVCFFLWGLLT